MRGIGLPRVTQPRIPVVYSSSDTDVDVWVSAGSPSISVQVDVYVEPGVTLSATSTAVAAMDMSGFAAGSTIFLINKGDIRGAGGDGGIGIRNTSGSPDWWSGCGGGGAGTTVGLGGGQSEPYPVAAQGADGTATAGGAGGLEATDIDTVNTAPTDGLPGGDAIHSGGTTLYIQNLVGTSTIWGGGGGGGGAWKFADPGVNYGGDGGDPGDAGLAGIQATSGEQTSGGAGGYAIRGTGTITFVSGGLDPEVKGSVGT